MQEISAEFLGKIKTGCWMREWGSEVERQIMLQGEFRSLNDINFRGHF